jgi:hypothetical protein
MTLANVLTVRPQPADGVPLVWAQRRLQATVAHAAIDIDRAAETVTWHGETARETPLTFRLSREAPGSQPVLQALVVADMVQAAYASAGLYRRILFVADDGRVLARTRPQSERAFDTIWPAATWQQLHALGVDVRREHFRRGPDMQRTYPGSDPTWMWHTRGLGTALRAGVFIVLVALVVMLAGFGVIS